MKRIFTICTLFGTVALAAQTEGENPFGESFKDMFQVDIADITISEGVMDNPPPPVPLDGGLTALLLVGGAAGYRQYKKTKALR